MQSHYKGTTKITEVIRLELPYLPTNKSNNPVICVSIKCAFSPMTMYCALNRISFASQGFCHWNHSLLSVYKFLCATEFIFLQFTDTSYNTFQLKTSPKQQPIHNLHGAPPHSSTTPSFCSSFFIILFIIFSYLIKYWHVSFNGITLKAVCFIKKNKVFDMIFFFN